MKTSPRQKIVSILLPTFFLSILPQPQAHAAPWWEGSPTIVEATSPSGSPPIVAEKPPTLTDKAVIKSCRTAEERESAAHPLYKMRAPAGGVGYGVKTQMEAQPSTLMYPPSAPPPASEPKKDEGRLDVHQAGKKVDKEIQKASSLYLSNDDSMSLASAQRIIYAVNNFLPIYRNEIRPHEFLNYFHFQTTNPQTDSGADPFSVNFQMAPRENGETLALAVQGKKLSNAERRPAVLTLILDKSGSMASDGKMEFLKEGMAVLKGQFKNGDVINVVEFDHEICTAIEGFVVGRDSIQGYDQMVGELEPRGSTDLHKGLVEGYRLAEKFRQPGAINRVILITDAIANTGELSPELMASIGRYYDTQKIALSGIGVGLDFNDELLDTLTDKGKGAYLFVGIKEAIPRVFGEDFISLLETVARNVHFQAGFPKDLHLEIFYGEEVSTEKAKVQPIHYFANSSQLFLLDLAGKITDPNPQFSLKIEYEDPISGSPKEQTLTRTVAQIRENGQRNVAKARLIMAFAALMEKTSITGNRPYGRWHGRVEPAAQDKVEGKKLCGETVTEMNKLQETHSDTETQYVLGLTQKYCSRF